MRSGISAFSAKNIRSYLEPILISSFLVIRRQTSVSSFMEYDFSKYNCFKRSYKNIISVIFIPSSVSLFSSSILYIIISVCKINLRYLFCSYWILLIADFSSSFPFGLDKVFNILILTKNCKNSVKNES